MALRISPAAAREVARNTSFRQARTCYGHLAGVAGVALLDALVGRGWVTPYLGERGCTSESLTMTGLQACAWLPIRATSGRPCLDWTERRPHLGGALGRALTEALIADGVLLPGERPRHITVTGSIEAWLERQPRAGALPLAP